MQQCGPSNLALNLTYCANTCPPNGINFYSTSNLNSGNNEYLTYSNLNNPIGNVYIGLSQPCGDTS